MATGKIKAACRPRLTVCEAKALLNECVDLARRVIGECGNNRIACPQNLWILSRLASMASSARSIPVLLDARQYWDVKFINRSIHDACIDIVYLLHDPSMTDELIQLLKIEWAVDEYQWCRHVKTRHSQYKDIPAEARALAESHFARAKREYKLAQLHPAFNASARDWPKRWQKISHNEEVKAIKKGSPPKKLVT
jgi:hypothetical protein